MYNSLLFKISKLFLYFLEFNILFVFNVLIFFNILSNEFNGPSKLNLTIIGENKSTTSGDLKLDSVFTDDRNGRCLLELIIIEKE